MAGARGSAATRAWSPTPSSRAITAAAYGGGIYHYRGGLAADCLVSANEAASYGVGAYLPGRPGAGVRAQQQHRGQSRESGVRVPGGAAEDSELVDNASREGGGLYAYYGGVLSNCFVETSGTQTAGGVYFDPGRGRSSQLPDGGGARATKAAGWGGSIRGGASCATAVSIGNAARYDGGGVYCWYAGLTVDNCTVYRQPGRSGGGVYCYSGGTIHATAWCTTTRPRRGRLVQRRHRHELHIQLHLPQPEPDGPRHRPPRSWGSGNPHLRLQDSPCIDSGRQCRGRRALISTGRPGSRWHVDIGCDEVTAGSVAGSLAVAVDSELGTLAVQGGAFSSVSPAIAGAAHRYELDFADGTRVTNLPAVTHPYAATGTYPVI